MTAPIAASLAALAAVGYAMTMRARNFRGDCWTRVTAVASTALLAACMSSSNGGGAAACGDVGACGGDITGTWRVEALCFDPPPPPDDSPPECSDLLRSVDADADATYTFGDDGTVTVDGTLELTFQFVYTPECIEALAGGPAQLSAADCSRLGQELVTDSDSFDSGSCRMVGGDCNCALSSTQPIASSGQPYRVEGTDLIDDSDGSRSGYCVDGDTLTIDEPDMSMSGGVMILRRQ